MDIEFHRIIAESKILHTFNQFLMFQFSERRKRQIAQGNCLILQSKKGENQQTNVYLKMNNLDYLNTITKNLFVKVTYQNSTAYIFFEESKQNMVYAITTLNKSACLSILDDLLKREAKVIQYQNPSLPYEVRLKIDFHCEKILQNEIIFYFNTTARIGKTIGHFFGSISQKLSKTVQQAENTFNKKVETVGRQSFSNQTRTKWQNIKQTAYNFNEKITDLIKPVSEKASELAEKMSLTYNHSQNSIIKTVRQFSKQAQNSINQGYIQENKDIKSGQTASNISRMQTELQSPNNQKGLRVSMIKDDYPPV